jgi:hypothetical protein
MDSWPPLRKKKCSCIFSWCSSPTVRDYPFELSLDQYIEARDALIRKDLIGFDGTLFQVLCLPEKPNKDSSPKAGQLFERDKDPVALGQILSQCFRGGRRNG